MSEIIGFLLAAVAFLLFQGNNASTAANAQRQPRENQAAVQHAQVVRGARKEVNANFATYLAAAQTGHVTIIPATMKADGSLGPGFVDNNFFGQKHVVVLYAPTALTLQGVVATCGGNRIPDQTLIRLATLAGQQTGEDSGFVLSTAPTIATAATGQDSQPISNFTNTACTITSGSLATLIYFDGSVQTPPLLSRYPVPNVPEAMRLHGDVDANGNNLNNVDDVKSSVTGLTLANAASAPQFVASQGVVSKPTCPAGMTAGIYGAPSSFSANGNGLPIIGLHAYAVDNGNKTWTPFLVADTESPTTPGTLQQTTLDSSHGTLWITVNCH